MSVLFSGERHLVNQLFEFGDFHIKWRQIGINKTSFNPLAHVLNALASEDHIIHVTLTSIPPPQQVSSGEFQTPGGWQGKDSPGFSTSTYFLWKSTRMVESTANIMHNFGSFSFHATRKDIFNTRRNWSKTLKSIPRTVIFNKICLDEGTLPKYTTTNQ